MGQIYSNIILNYLHLHLHLHLHLYIYKHKYKYKYKCLYIQDINKQLNHN